MNQTPALYRRIPANTTGGKDYVVGDIHGTLERLKTDLVDLGFNPLKDRLFSVGDLVDRGPDSAGVVALLKEPWFFAIKGNHEDMAIRWFDRKPGADSCEMPIEGWDMDAPGYARNGGMWFIQLDEPAQLQIINSIRHLPLALELETSEGLLGIIHAEVIYDDWTRMKEMFDSYVPGKYSKAFKTAERVAMWERDKVEDLRTFEAIKGIDAVVCGHTPMKDPRILDNQMYIDTMGWREYGRFTILEASKVIQIVRAAAKEE